MTPEDHELWAAMPQTREVFADADAEVERLKEEIANGGTINSDNPSQTAMITARYVGQIQGMRWFMSVAPEKLEEGKED